ncbi:hypothetical protein C1H46_041174 [Malus baccata]|uniref:Mediator of RNA polymerase II transcription subunit 23 n=1 Tax=Malus baccata TaxID=106549 RepID=A0A540KGF7_MALBA|nr:hypothetical protein C1H46_041174 [Malus baccata]
MNLCLKLAYQMEESLFSGQVVPSIAMAETYCRLLLIAPHSLFRSHFNHLAQRNPSVLSKPGVTLLVLEILNYRLLPLYRYQGKSKALMYDVTKIVSALKSKRGDHRVFRLAENLCMNLILSLRDFFLGPTEFTETLNRVTIVTLAIIIKTRGIADADHLLYLQTMLEQILATSNHTWSEKTLRYFPSLLRDFLIQRIDKRGLAIQEWQQAETTVINQCTQLLSPSADPTYVMTYISHSFPQHRQYLCAGAWILMQGHPENINSLNLARVLREFSPEEVTSNIYTMVDVLLHHIQLELQHGHSLQDLLLKACANLAFYIWTHELIPLDILLLALIDRDDDPHALHIVMSLLDRQELQQRVKQYCSNRGPPEHWLVSTSFKRTPPPSQSGQANVSDGQKAFYQIQDPGTYTQLVLETAVIELLSLPVSASQIVSSLVQIVVNIQPTLIQSSNGLHGAPSGVGQGSVLPTSPSGGSTDSLGTSRSPASVSGINASNFVSRSGYTCQQLSCLLIQACGLLLAQLPPDFHVQLYLEASRIIKETWWLSDGKRSMGELDSAVGYALLDPTWAAQDNTSTAIGNIVALLHSFFSNLPQEWLEGTHLIIKHLRPVTSVAMLRIAFRIMGPLLPKLANAHALFSKTLSLILSMMVDVFGKNVQPPTPVEPLEIADLIDFFHHVVHYEGQGGPVQANSKPRPEVLALCGRAAESLRPDIQHLLSHLKPDTNSSIYAATHPKLNQNSS